MKQYDRTDLLDTAIELFRINGYNGTSTAQLVDALGVNRKSMYAEFGSKQGLFEAALERYDEEHLSNVLAPLEAPGAAADAIRGAFASYAGEADGWVKGKGCLMCNTAVEAAALDPGAAKFVDAYIARVTAAFRHALGNADAAGDVPEDADLDELAAFLMMSLIGVVALIRAQADASLVHAACRVATDRLG
ncbi:MAG: TetR/AcrR family transcriptional regulator [Actinomycetota bacterium]